MTITKQQKIDAMDRIFDGSVELVSESEMALSAVEEYLDFARHVRTPAGAERFGVPIGSPIGDRPSKEETEKYEALKKKYAHLDAKVSFVDDKSAEVKTAKAGKSGFQREVSSYGKTAPTEDLVSKYYKVQANDKATAAFKKDAGFPFSRFMSSSVAQDHVLNEMDDGDPARSWALYQVDGPYQAINGYLRTGQHVYRSQSTGMTFNGAELAEGMNKAFKKYGVTTDKPMTTFRGIGPSKHIDYGKFKAGDVFTEKGIMSTAVNRDDVMGFLDGDDLADVGSDKSVVELHLPSGQRILGAYTGGIETMLPPGTKFKVLSNTKKQLTTDTVNENNEHITGNVNYIVAEVV